MKYEIPSIILKPGKERAVKNFHPWIFSGACKFIAQNLEPGTLVMVRSHEGQALALGHYCSPVGLVIRLCSFNPEQAIDADFWRSRLVRAHALRKRLALPNNHTSAYRLIHGEGDLFPGLVCDIYADAASLKLSNPGLLPLMPLICDYLQKELLLQTIFLEEEGKKARALCGTAQSVSFKENGLSFVAHLEEGQKTGYFLDQRENRFLLQRYAAKRRILDAFCYSGGFSIHALAGDAAQVTSVDISERATTWCKENLSLNGPFAGAHQAISEDCFALLRSIKPEAYDLIVLDPPAFAKSAHAVDKAARGYKDINLLALKALDKNGLLFTFSCSQHISADLFQKILFAAAKDSKREVTLLHELRQGPDHPTSLYCPQSSYLKGLVLSVD